MGIEKLEKKLEMAKDTAISSEIASLTKSTFLAKMSHELRSPMNGVLGMIRLLLDSELDEKQKNHAKSAYAAAEKLFAAVKELSDFVSVDVEKLEIDSYPFDLFKAGEEVIKFMSGKAGVKNIKLIYEFESNTPNLLVGDAVKVMQVIANLLDNAINFTEKGSVELLVRTKYKDSENCGIIFEVKDKGPGIAAEKLEAIFDFTDDTAATSPERTKICLELAVCRKILAAMNGTVEAESVPGEGASFIIEMPFKIAKASAVQEPMKVEKNTSAPIAGDKPYNGIKVLLAEDDIINQSLAVAFISKLGGKVDIAANGQIAVNKFKENENAYDVIFMDCEMPEMDGFDATKAIRELETAGSLKRIPVIAMTAYALQGDKERCFAAGMDSHIPKPVTVNALNQVLKDYIIPDNFDK